MCEICSKLTIKTPECRHAGDILNNSEDSASACFHSYVMHRFENVQYV